MPCSGIVLNINKKSKMDISEIKELRNELEVDIAKKILDFQNKTGVSVANISVSREQIFNAYEVLPYSEQIEVKIEIRL